MSEPDWPLTETRLIEPFDTSWRICSRNGELDGAELLRTVRNGAKRAAISTSPMKRAVTVSRSQQKLTRSGLFIVARIAKQNFHECAAFAARSRVSHVAE